MPDNFIDDLAKGNLENFRPQYNATDWNAMEKLLDEKPVAQVPFWKSGAMMMAASFVLLLTGGIAGYYLGYFTGSNSNIPNPSYSMDFPAPVKSSDLNIKPATTDEIIVPPAVLPVYKHNAMASNKSDFVPLPILENAQDQDIITREDLYLNAMHSLNAGLLHGKDIKLKMKRNKIIASENKFGTQFSLGLSFAPDMNFPDKTRGGFTTGLTAEARISERFALISGINYTEKSYVDKPEKEFAEMFKSSGDLKQTTASFKMLEVPLLLKYYLSPKSRVKPFVTAGVSNYFPIEEKYEVQCVVETVVEDPNVYGQTITTTEENNINLTANSYSTGSQYSFQDTKSVVSSVVENVSNYNLKPYLGFINIGAGVRYDVSPRLSLQMNPQMKLAVAGIGLEEKMMSTLSFNTTVLYNIR